MDVASHPMGNHILPKKIHDNLILFYKSLATLPKHTYHILLGRHLFTSLSLNSLTRAKPMEV